MTRERTYKDPDVAIAELQDGWSPKCWCGPAFMAKALSGLILGTLLSHTIYYVIQCVKFCVLWAVF